MNKEDLKEFNDNFQDASKNLAIACLSLRGFYTCDIPDEITEFTVLRQKVTNHAIVYKDKVFPFAEEVVSDVKKIVDTYKDFEFNQFKESIESFTIKVDEAHRLVEYTSKLHFKILENFKEEEDATIKILHKFQNEKKVIDEKVAKLRKAAAAEDYNFAVGLVLIPDVKEIACSILEIQAVDYEEHAIEKDKSKYIATMITIIKDILDKSINNFVTSLTTFAGFFYRIKKDIESLQGEEDDVSAFRYYGIRAPMKKISKSCEDYFDKIPGIITDLNVIPKECDKVYVNEWYIKQEIEYEGRKISLLEHGESLFKGKKRYLKLLATHPTK